MRRADFDHLVAAAAEITGLDDLVVIGSQAILGPLRDAPALLLDSMEVDMYPRADPAKADEIDGVLGDGSSFHDTNGYYAHGVGPETAKAPAGWEERLVPIAVPPRVGSARHPVAWCLEPHDLVLSKCAAGRPRDFAYAKEALRAGIVDRAVLQARIDDLPVSDIERGHVRSMLEGIVAQLVREPGSR